MARLDNTGKMLAICGGKVYTMNGAPLGHGCILIEKGKSSWDASHYDIQYDAIKKALGK